MDLEEPEDKRIIISKNQTLLIESKVQKIYGKMKVKGSDWCPIVPNKLPSKHLNFGILMKGYTSKLKSPKNFSQNQISDKLTRKSFRRYTKSSVPQPEQEPPLPRSSVIEHSFDLRKN